MRLFLLVLATLFISTSQSFAVEAQSKTTISVAPAILDLAVNPGEAVQSILTIRNGGGFALPVSVTPKSLFTEDEFLDPSNRNITDASKWIELENNEFILDENEVKKLVVDINIPDDASPGGHYAQLSVRGLSLEQTLDAGSSIVIPEVAVTVLISVAGETETSIVFDENRGFLPLFATPSTDLMSSFYISNKGNIHDLITPTLVIEKDREELYRQALSSKIILPQTRKEFNEILQLPDDYGDYEAYLEISYSNGQKTIITDKETILVTPSLRSIFIVGFLTIGGLYFYNHRKNINKAWRILTKN